MSKKNELLKLLYIYSETYLTSEKLCIKLGLRPSALHKMIEELRKEGYNITGYQGKGYSISATTDPITAQSIQAYYPMEKEKIRIFNSLPSTNATAKEMAILGAPEGTLCIATHQTKGRGRMDRVFFSPKDSGVYFSVILRPQLRPEGALSITTLAAVSVCRAIEAVTGEEAQIKWVNDVFYKGKKVCGILTESALSEDYTRLNYVILGIGINIYSPRNGFPAELQSIAGSIFDSPIENGRARILAGTLKYFFEGYKHIENNEHLHTYKEKCFLPGKEVTVIQGDTIYPARALEICDDFSLSVEKSDGEVEHLLSGEVSIRMENAK